MTREPMTVVRDSFAPAGDRPRALDALRGVVHGAVVRTVVESAGTDRWVDPETAYLAVVGDSRYAFWLDAGQNERVGTTYLGALGPRGAVLSARPDSGGIEVLMPATSETLSLPGSILDLVDDLLSPEAAARDARNRSCDDRGLDRGLVGWLGYETGAHGLGIAHAPSATADTVLLVVDRVIAFDHESRSVRVIASSDDDEWMLATIAQLEALVDAPPPPAPPAPRSTTLARARHSRAAYLERLDRCRRAIIDGEAYQLCLTNQLDIESTEEPVDVYRRLRELNPSAHGSLIRAGDDSIVSSSPETFVRVSPEGQIVTRPIKGTRPRSDDPEIDAALRRDLLESDKERAENVMIVDLMRNDLGRVAVTGSVEVPELFRVEAYRTVYQLVSTVTAQLAPGRSTVDVIRSAFPAGSMTGAPKLSAMAILAGLEDGPRGAYAGAFGFISTRGSADLSMTIRTIVMSGARATIGTGGGITALSDPEEEYAEMILKATAPLVALGAELEAGP